MWFVVTLGSPWSLNSASEASRIRWRVCLAMPARGPSGKQLLDQRHVLLHGLLAAGALQFLPGLVLRGADEIHEARARTPDVTLGALLVECVQAEHGVVVGTVGQRLDVRGGI